MEEKGIVPQENLLAAVCKWIFVEWHMYNVHAFVGNKNMMLCLQID